MALNRIWDWTSPAAGPRNIPAGRQTPGAAVGTFRLPNVPDLPFTTMRDDYVTAALLVIDDPNILINDVSRRVKQLKRGNRALVESLEKLSAEDTALREIIERKISYELATPAEIAAARR